MFKSLNLYGRILLGFAAITLLLIILAILTVTSLNTSMREFNSYRDTIGGLELSTQIEEDILLGQLDVENYLQTNASEKVESFSERMGIVKEKVAQFSSGMDNSKMQTNIKTITDNVESFESTFGKIVQLTQNQNILVNEHLIILGEKMEEQLTGLMNDAFGNGDTLASFGTGQAIKNILRLRNAIFRLLNTRDMALVELIETEFANADQSMEFLDKMIKNLNFRHYVEDTSADFVMFKDYYSQFEESMKLRNEEIMNLENLKEPIFSSTNGLRQFMRAEQISLGNKVEEYNRLMQLIIIIIMIAGVVLAVIVSLLVARGIVKPIRKLAASIKEFGEGNLKQDFSIEGKNEVVTMANILQEMADSLRESISSISQAIEQVDESSEDLNTIAQESSADSELLSEQSEKIEENIESTTASIQEVNAGIEEIASSSQNVARVAQELATDTDNAELKTKEGNKIVSEMLINMETVNEQSKETERIVGGLSENAKNVGKIVETISSISEQTNLLALNAAIEAARAGEAGKGFAVVADEIRKLAEESKKSTVNIDGILKEIQKGTRMVRDASGKNVEYVESLTQKAKEVDKSFKTILDSIEHISNAVEDLAGSAQEQSASTDEITKGVDTSSNNMNNVSEEIKNLTKSAEKQSVNSERISSSAAELYAMAESLGEQIKHFKY